MITRSTILNLFKRYLSRFSDNTAVLDKRKNFRFVAEFDANAHTIKTDVDAYIHQHWKVLPSFDAIDANQRRLVNHDGHQWKVLVVKMYGEYVNTQVSATLMRLLKKHNQVISSATISCMEAGKHIPAHCGPNKAILRYTLPLKVPSDGECCLIIDDQKIPLKEGEGILWDDTFKHEAMNKSTGIRVALLLDLKRTLPKPIEYLYDFVLILLRQSKKFKSATLAAKMGR